MAEYEPLDLSELCNAGLDVLERPGPPLIGAHVFHGLPFLIGRPEADDRACFLGFGRGLCEAPLRVPIERSARRVVVAHRLIDSDVPQGGQIGKPVAEYLFHLKDGTAVRVPIRERFEISIIPDSIWWMPVLPFGAVHDAQPRVYPRQGGSWDAAGHRMEEISRATPRAG
jgi:hypothetical protein